jgi:hypothetical protein
MSIPASTQPASEDGDGVTVHEAISAPGADLGTRASANPDVVLEDDPPDELEGEYEPL